MKSKSGRMRAPEKDYYTEVTLVMPEWQVSKLRGYAKLYRTSLGGMMGIISSYYFGDGHNHLRCEHCVFGTGETCDLPEKGEQTTIPLLDKGIVVVGHPLPDQGF